LLTAPCLISVAAFKALNTAFGEAGTYLPDFGAASEGKTFVDLEKTVSTADDLNAAFAQNSKYVNLPKDGSVPSNADIVMAEDATLNGNGATIDKAAAPSDNGSNAGVRTSGGKIENVTIQGQSSTDTNSNGDNYGFRAVYDYANQGGGLTSDLTLNNVKLFGTYAINIGNGNGYALSVKNSELNGWTSFAGLSNASFDDVDFTKADEHIRPYVNTVFTDCDFAAGYSMSVHDEESDDTSAITIVFENCTVGSTEVTAENVAELFQLEANDPNYGEYTIIVR